MKLINKKLILGTALWGWGIDKKQAFLMLDFFVSFGGRYIDCATNYPINGRNKDYGLALKWLQEWIRINKIKLFIIIKVGSIDNLGSPFYDLSKNRVLSLYEEMKLNFGESLWCISVHWDNRNNDKDFTIVQETVNVFKELRNNGVSIGLSGIKRPELYFKSMPELSSNWIIQCKENFLTQDARLKYQQFFPNAEYYAYGINMGGLKLLENEKSVSAKIRKIDYSNSLKNIIADSLKNKNIIDFGFNCVNDLSMAFIFFNTLYSGVIIGSRTVEQLSSTYKIHQILGNLKFDELTNLNNLINNLHKRIKCLEKSY